MKKTYLGTIVTGLILTTSLSSTQVHAAEWSKTTDGQMIAAKSSVSQATPEKITDTTNQVGQQEDPAITRTRKQIQMLDDLYKTAVLIFLHCDQNQGWRRNSFQCAGP